MCNLVECHWNWKKLSSPRKSKLPVECWRWYQLPATKLHPNHGLLSVELQQWAWNRWMHWSMHAKPVHQIRWHWYSTETPTPRCKVTSKHKTLPWHRKPQAIFKQPSKGRAVLGFQHDWCCHLGETATGPAPAKTTSDTARNALA